MSPHRFAWIALLALCCTAQAQAGIDVDWSRATRRFTPAQKAAIEKRIDEAALLFLDESYADLGKLDIRAHARTVLVQIRDFGTNRERGLHLSGAVFLNQDRLDDLDAARLTLVHELSHVYDFLALSEMMMDYLLSPESGDGRVAEKRLDEPMRAMGRIKDAAEKRAHERMTRYAHDQGLKVPEVHE
ncbi:MAG: hypothetical protein HYY25_01320 [Candidatus Wallbacteria bacterium]|nr:hypothetical protein [Candidatus Wallbacteria bacterium]MBI4868006.1 hypothetical protein [Candidatus Wallbacteria bacterium]